MDLDDSHGIRPSILDSLEGGVVAFRPAEHADLRL